MKKIVGIGDTDIDLYVKVPKIAGNDEKVLGELLGEFPGGMIGNFCSAVAKFGHRNVEIISALGKDYYGMMALEAFHMLGVGLEGLQILEDSRTYFCIVYIDPSGEKSLTIVPTEAMYPRPSLINKTLLLDADYVHTIGGNEKLLQYICENKSKKSILSIDLETTMLEQFMRNENLIHEVDILFTNKQTIETIIPDSSIEDGLKKLAQRGFGTIVLTAGRDGSVVYREKTKTFYHQHAFTVKPVDTTGAGDCYSAIFLSCLANGDSIQVAMQYASAGAAISIQSVGARTGLPSRKEIDYFLATYKG